jgi:hypothetical protein
MSIGQKASVTTFQKALFKIQYPNKWTIDTSGMMGSEFFIFSPKESANDKFRENVNLIVQDISGQNIDLDKYAQISKDEINAIGDAARIYESKKIKKGKSEFYKMIYDMEQEAFKVKIEQYYFVTSARAYVLTLATESTKFANFKTVGEAVLNSFQLRNEQVAISFNK